VPCDAAIATLQSPAFARLVDGVPGASPEYVQQLHDWPYQGNICMVLQLRQSLSSIYWLNIADPRVPFTALVEHTNLAPREWYGGKHIFYIGKYLGTSHPHWSLSDAALARTWLPNVRTIFPHFSDDLIEERWVFRAPYAQPVVTVGYGERIPDIRTPVKGLYLANMTQIYPEDRGMNYSIRLGHQVADAVLQDSPTLRRVGAGTAGSR
jgi:protoporphyrinogen oxidase